jgi:hypothetical protein
MRDMTPETVRIPEPDAPRMSAVSRVAGVFFEPSKTFEDIGRRPTWLVPLLLLIVATLAVVTVTAKRVGFEQVIRQQFENSSRAAQMTAEQREQAIAMQVRVGGMFAYAVPIFLPIYYLVVSGVMLGFTAMMSAGLRFKQVFAVVCHANLPALVSALLTIVVMFLKNPTEINVQNPLAFNPAAFMDPASTSKFVYSLSSSLDLFSFWIMFLMATGFKAAAGRKLSFGGALAAVVIPWAVWVLLKSTLAGVFS